MRTTLRLLARELLDALLPPLCFLCGRPPAEVRAFDGIACDHHAWTDGLAGARCGRCAARLGEGLPDGYPCVACRARTPAFRAVLALADYRPEEPLRDWVLAFKHGGRRDLARPLGARLAEALRAAADEDGGGRPLLVPVPLHPLRRLERGYDQARLLADAVAAAGLRARVAPALARVRRTLPQGSPGAAGRRANVRGAFRPREGCERLLAGADVWLVDDVVTSGATAHEAARALRAAGAARVRVAALARSPLPPRPG